MRKIITSLAAITVVVFGMYACDIPGLNSSKDNGDSTLAPTISLQPVDAMAPLGETAMFVVKASGGTLTYQWMKGSSNLTGKTSDTLTLTNISASDTGSYKCKVSNSSGSVTSNTVHLGIGTANASGLLEFDLSILNAPSGATGTIITRQIIYDCDSTTSVADTSIDTSFYAVTGGKLYTWDSSTACYASQQMSGTSSTIIGTWTETVTSGVSQVLIPAAYRPAGCTGIQDTTYDDFGGLFQNPSITYTVSSTKIHAKISGDVCFADLFAESFADSANGIIVTNVGCSSVDISNSSNHKLATITNTFSNNTLGIQFKSGTSTCTTSEVIPVPGVVRNCSQPEDTTFFSCLEGTPFFANASAKKAVGGNSLLQQRLRKSISMKWKRF